MIPSTLTILMVMIRSVDLGETILSMASKAITGSIVETAMIRSMVINILIQSSVAKGMIRSIDINEQIYWTDEMVMTGSMVEPTMISYTAELVMILCYEHKIWMRSMAVMVMMISMASHSLIYYMATRVTIS